jgi:hypothetical protein
MSSRLAIISITFATAITLDANRAHAQAGPDEIFAAMAPNHGPSKAGTRDCEKAAADQKKHMDANMDNPQAAVFGGAKLACSYLEEIAWKPPTTKTAPKASPGKDAPSTATVVARAGDFWAGSDDLDYVKVLSGGVAGAWDTKTMSDVPGLPSARSISVFTTIVAALANNETGCFVVYGQLYQKNVNHPDKTMPVSWGGLEYQATNWQRAQKIACPKGAKAPTPKSE